LKKQRHLEVHTAVPDPADPAKIERTMVKAALPANDDPVDPSQIQRRQGHQQRLERQESRGSRDPPQSVRTPAVLIGLDRRPDPHIRHRPNERPGRQVLEPPSRPGCDHGLDRGPNQPRGELLPPEHRRQPAWTLRSSWNECCGDSAITTNIRATNQAGTWAWPTSLIELTKTLRGFRHRSGSSSKSS